MDGGCDASALGDRDVVRRAHAPCQDAGRAIAEISAALGAGPFAAVMLFISPEADLAAVVSAAGRSFAGSAVIGCTTAGEISPKGYASGEIVAIGLPEAHFSAYITVVEDLAFFDKRALASDLMSARSEQAQERPDWNGLFGFLMVDGMSQKEDALTAAVSNALGPTPLFGGSAGDGLRFGETFVIAGGKIMSNAAIIALIATDFEVETFRIDHLKPTDARMVVTGADPERRIVYEINAEPAAREYARILGKDTEQLSPFIFAAHPVLVRIGGQHYVRAIRQVAPNGDLIFFSAIDEGLVLTLAEPMEIAPHLDTALTRLTAGRPPATLIGCDCILRRVEAEQKQVVRDVSEVLRRHRVIGFNTYGEQSGGAHVSQTLTGVALWPPKG